MKTYYSLIILTFSSFFISCSESELNTTNAVVELNPVEIANKEFHSELAGFKDTTMLFFYSANDNRLLWLDDSLKLNSRAKELLKFIENIGSYGLNQKHYVSEKQLSLLSINSKDTLLTSTMLKLARNLRWSDFSFESEQNPFTKAEINELDFISKISNDFQSSSIYELLEGCQPKHHQYRSIVDALKRYVLRTKISKKKIKVPSNKQDSANFMSFVARALVIHGLIDSTDVDNTILTNAIKRFQQEHGLNQDGVVGRKTAKLLSKSPYDYYLTAVLSLDKWRQKETWAKSRIEINIPEYRLRYYENGKQLRTHKVIVGNVKAQTIEILDSVEYLVVYPYWYVPRSIINHEMLPKARKDSTYFRRKGFELLSGKKVVDSDKINYKKSFRYTVRQKGGSSNALGLVKFIFPNPSSIYLHDTPTKHLFKKEIRAFSHDCIRLQDPLDLAYSVLENDGSSYSSEKVKELISLKERKRINLKSKLPIFVHYTLASAKDSLIVFNEDVYSREKKSIKKLRKIFK